VNKQIRSATFSTRNFDPLTPLDSKFPNFAIQILLFRLKHSCRRHTCTCAIIFLHHLGTGVACQKTTFRTKIGGGWARGASKKFGTPYVFLQPLKLATSNFGTQIGFGTSLPKKRRLGPKLEGAWLGEHPKIWDPLRISVTVEASNFKFGTQIGFGTSLPENNVFDPNWQGSGLVEHLKKFGTPYVFLQLLKLAISNLVHKFGLGLDYQKTAFRTKIGGVLARGAS